MLSLERCRRIVGRASDAELEQAREQLYGLADVVCRAFAGRYEYARGVRAEFDDALRLLPRDDADDARERAAIIEFDGARNRDEAERQALVTVVGKRRPART